MKKEEHEQRTIEMFGKPWTEVHAFLDQYFGQYGPYHRVLLYHRLGIALICKEIPGPVRQVAEQHIIDDLGYIPDDPYAPEFTMDRDLCNGWNMGNDYKAEIEQLYPDWRPHVFFYRR